LWLVVDAAGPFFIWQWVSLDGRILPRLRFYASLAAAVAPASLRGRYLALSSLSFSAAMAVIPLLATALLAASPAALWLTLAPLMIAAAAMVARLECRLPASALRAPHSQLSISPACEVEPSLATCSCE
jgi:hypothetical protein